MKALRSNRSLRKVFPIGTTIASSEALSRITPVTANLAHGDGGGTPWIAQLLFTTDLRFVLACARYNRVGRPRCGASGPKQAVGAFRNSLNWYRSPTHKRTMTKFGQSAP